MKTALKLNKKDLFSLYQKSSELVKKNLRMEFGEGFFVMEEAKPEANIVAIKNPKSPNVKNRKVFIDWEMMFDFSPVLRIAVYAFLMLLIFA